MAEDQSFVAVVPPNSLVARRSRDGARDYWKATDPNGIVWTIWDVTVATEYSNLQGTGRQALWSGRVAPAADPRYGMNYDLKSISAINGSIQQGVAAAAPSVAPDVALAQSLGQLPVQQVPQASPQPAAAAAAAAGVPQPPSQTLGQGGNFSDSDILRMARSTAVEAVSRFAIVFPDEFKDAKGGIDWGKLYLAAEALAKFITHRQHQGWTPGVEIAPKPPISEQDLIAEVNAEFPGALTKGMPEPGEPSDASAENADGGEIDWQ